MLYFDLIYKDIINIMISYFNYDMLKIYDIIYHKFLLRLNYKIIFLLKYNKLYQHKNLLDDITSLNKYLQLLGLKLTQSHSSLEDKYTNLTKLTNFNNQLIYDF